MSDNDTKPLTEVAIEAWVAKARNQNFGGFPGNPCGSYVLHGSEIIQALNMLHGALAEIAELRERIEKLDGDVDHFHRKWKEAEKCAAKAELERGRVQADFEAQRSWGWKMQQRAEKAEAELVEATKDHAAALRRLSNATSGVAMLRRLREWLHNGGAEVDEGDGGSCYDDVGMAIDEIDRLIAEAAENLITSTADGEGLHREGDDVLRDYVEWFGGLAPEMTSKTGDAVSELCRRALGEGDAS